MYKSFEIKNFKCFEHLKLDNLARVNLITGKNNVGKTALLEALYIHTGSYNPSLALVIRQSRGYGHPAPGNVLEGRQFWSWLFREFDTEKTIELAAGELPGQRRTLKIRVVRQPDKGRPVHSSQRIRTDDSGNVFISGRPLVLEFEYTHGNNRTKHWAVPGADGRPMPYPPPPPPPFPSMFTIAKKEVNHTFYAELFGKLRRQSKHGHLVTALRQLEPKLTDLTVIPVANQSMIHGEIGLPQTVALADMGGGMVRLAGLLLAISDVREGISFIDEIENGLHYSILEKVWRAIAEAARQFNVQVFATTHSFECIEAAHKAFHGEHASDFRLFRLERVKGKIKPFDYDPDVLEAAIQTDLEVR